MQKQLYNDYIHTHTQMYRYIAELLCIYYMCACVKRVYTVIMCSVRIKYEVQYK